jgi:spore germination cell wall hydrolase CwlJ-like protein
MRVLSAIALAVLILTSSCVPPSGAGRGFALDAPRVAPRAQAARTVSPGPWLSAMPKALAPIPAAEPEIAAIAANPFAPAAQSPQDAARALDCLTAAIYYEARSEGVDGQRAVAQVVLNRVRNPAFPASVCGVVYQGSTRSTGCQFTFTCDGSLLARREPEAWERAGLVARAALAGDVYAPVGLATYYHATSVSPWWAPSLTRVTQIGAHIFYRWPGAWGGLSAFRQSYAGVEPADAAATPAATDPGDVIRFAVGDGSTVTIHRGEAFASTADDGGTTGVRVHRGNAATAPAAPPAADETANARDDGAVHVHSGSAPGTGDEPLPTVTTN